VFGVSELAVLQRLLDGAGSGGGAPSVRDMVLASEEEGLSEGALAALRASRAAAGAAAAGRRGALQARAAERAYQALLARGSGASAREAAPVRTVATQASLGGGLFLVLLSAALMGYYLGLQLYGAGSTGVRPPSSVFQLTHTRAQRPAPTDTLTPTRLPTCRRRGCARC